MTQVDRPQRWWHLFPPDADRPWRAVFVLVDHELRRDARNAMFWVGPVLLALLFVAGAAVLAVSHAADAMPVTLVVPDPDMRATYLRHADPERVLVVAQAPDDATSAPVVTLSGADPDRPVLTAPSVRDATRARAEASLATLIDDVRAEHLPAAAPPPATRAPSVVRRATDGHGEPRRRQGVPAVLWCGLLGAFFAFLSAGDETNKLQQQRVDGSFATLRIGVPASALWLGATLGSLITNGLTVLIGTAATVVLLSVTAPFLPGNSVAPWWFGGTTAAIFASGSALVAGAFIGMGPFTALTRWRRPGCGWMMALLVFVPALAYVSARAIYAASYLTPAELLAYAGLPVAGVPVALQAIADGASPVWLLPALAGQAVWISASLFVGATRFTLDGESDGSTRAAARPRWLP